MGEKVLHIRIEDFLRFNLTGKSYQDKLFIVEMRGDREKEPDIHPEDAIRLDALSILLVCKGQIEITIDNFTYHLSDNHLLDIMDFHVIKGIRLSPDFRGYHIVIERQVFMEIMLNSRRLPVAYIASRRSRPIQELSEADSNLLENCICRIIWQMGRTSHSWQRDLILTELRGFLLEMNNVIFQSSRDHVNANPPNKDMLLFVFLQLLNEHCKEEHAVSFYADKLCITPEYLSRVLKEFSGKTVHKWIAEALIREAEILLRNPNHSIQQVSDWLNFSDQSSFGKFFKKHKGISPQGYRNNECPKM